MNVPLNRIDDRANSIFTAPNERHPTATRILAALFFLAGIILCARIL